MKSFDTLNKRAVQHYFYSTSKVKGNVLTLCGTVPQSVYKDYKLVCTKISKLILYDLNSKNLRKIKRKDIVCHHDNVINAKPERFMDIDLMRSIKTEGSIVETLFRQQLKMKTKYKRSFIFTVCARGCTLERLLTFIEELVEMKLIWQLDPFFFTTRRIAKAGNFYIEQLIYQDGTPMYSTRIYYESY